MQIHNTRRNHSYLDSALQGFVARFCSGGVKLKLDSRIGTDCEKTILRIAVGLWLLYTIFRVGVT